MLAVPYVAPVAQWIEHLTSNLVAVGSSPAGRVTVHSLSPNALPFLDCLLKLLIEAA